MQLPVNAPGRQQIMAPGLGPPTHVGDQEGFSGFWFQSELALAVAGIWGMNQQMEESLCICLSLPLSLVLSN